MIMSIVEDSEDSFTIATARYNKIAKNKKYYHTWVELDKGDKTLCLDYTRNLIMCSDLYYRLGFVNEPEIKRIPAKILKQDYDKIEKGAELHSNFVKFYLDDRDTAIRILDNELTIKDVCLQ